MFWVLHRDLQIKRHKNGISQEKVRRAPRSPLPEEIEKNPGTIDFFPFAFSNLWHHRTDCSPENSDFVFLRALCYFRFHLPFHRRELIDFIWIRSHTDDWPLKKFQGIFVCSLRVFSSENRRFILKCDWATQTLEEETLRGY